jgi:hypothetical protein
MGRDLLRLPWKSGPSADFGGPVLVSVTDFHVRAARDVAGVYVTGLRLRRAWPELEGAVGIWLWGKPLQKRSGAVSVWRTADDLRRFVSWPVHVAIMRKYRGVGTITTRDWEADRFIPAEVWRAASLRLATVGV